MAKNKLRRFAEMKAWNNVFEPTLDPATRDVFPLKNKWNEHFENEHPLVLELGCGKGEYSVGLAGHYPEKNFVGVDIKGARIFIGARDAIELERHNVAFLRAKIDFITTYFGLNEIDELWLTFSDPQPIKPRKRLTSPQFLERYRQILKKGGIVHLKTDSDLLFESTLEVIADEKLELIQSTWDLYHEMPANLDPTIRDIMHIKTHYEELFKAKGATIKYCSFRIH